MNYEYILLLKALLLLAVVFRYMYKDDGVAVFCIGDKNNSGHDENYRYVRGRGNIREGVRGKAVAVWLKRPSHRQCCQLAEFSAA